MRSARQIAVLVSAVVLLLFLFSTQTLSMIRRLETHHELVAFRGLKGQTKHVEIYWQEPDDGKLDILPSLSLRSPRKRKGRGFLPANSPD